MKIFLILLLFTISLISIWQRQVIHRLQNEEASEKKNFHEERVPRATLKDTGRNRPPIPAAGASSQQHLLYLKEINELPKVARLQAGHHWIENLKTSEALLIALAALSDDSLSASERDLYASRFGPVLFHQWGKIDPIGGWEKWQTLDPKFQRTLLGEHYSPHQSDTIGSNVTGDKGPPPTHLIYSWATLVEPDILNSIGKMDGLMVKTTFEALSELRPMNFLSYVNESADIQLQPLGSFGDSQQAWQTIDGSLTLVSSVKPSPKAARSMIREVWLPKVAESIVTTHGSAETAFGAIEPSEENQSLRLHLLGRMIASSSAPESNISNHQDLLREATPSAKLSLLKSMGESLSKAELRALFDVVTENADSFQRVAWGRAIGLPE